MEGPLQKMEGPFQKLSLRLRCSSQLISLASFLVWSCSCEALHKQDNLEMILARIILGGSTTSVADEAKELKKEHIYTAGQSGNLLFLDFIKSDCLS